MSLLSRILSGDFVWFALGGLSSLAGWLSVGWLRNRWARVACGLALACAGVWLAHQGYEAFHAWYTTPLGPGLELTR